MKAIVFSGEVISAIQNEYRFQRLRCSVFRLCCILELCVMLQAAVGTAMILQIIPRIKTSLLAISDFARTCQLLFLHIERLVFIPVQNLSHGFPATTPHPRVGERVRRFPNPIVTRISTRLIAHTGCAYTTDVYSRPSHTVSRGHRQTIDDSAAISNFPAVASVMVVSLEKLEHFPLTKDSRNQGPP